jgi:hypothetical protein
MGPKKASRKLVTAFWYNIEIRADILGSRPGFFFRCIKMVQVIRVWPKGPTAVMVYGEG